MHPSTPPPLFKHIWVFFIVATFVNAAIWWRRGREYRQRDPSLTEDYRSLIRGFVTWGNVPWLIMGVGILFGRVPTVFHYFNPRSPNPFVTAFFASIVFLWIVGTYWLFARRGAERLVRCPGLVRLPVNSAAAMKGFWILCLDGGVAGLVAMSFSEIPPPPVP